MTATIHNLLLQLCTRHQPQTLQQHSAVVISLIYACNHRRRPAGAALRAAAQYPYTCTFTYDATCTTITATQAHTPKPADIKEKHGFEPSQPVAADNPTYNYDVPCSEPAECASAKTDVHYYGYRYYNPELGRWIKRDPMGEEYIEFVMLAMEPNMESLRQAVLNILPSTQYDQLRIYDFLSNDPISSVDILGLTKVDPCKLAIQKGVLPEKGYWGFVVCYKGKKHVCVTGNLGNPPITEPGILECTREHEKYHANDPNLVCPKNGLCNPHVSETVSKDKHPHLVIECPAWKVGCDCLAKWYKKQTHIPYPVIKQYLAKLKHCNENKKTCGSYWP